MKFSLLSLFLLTMFAAEVNAQQKGLIKNTGTAQGYILIAPLFSKETYLIDRCGQIVRSWTSHYNPGQSVYLLNDGSLLRTGNDSSAWFFGGGGVIERFDWQGNLKWQYRISDSLQRQHHDICPLGNGHILVLVWEKIDRKTAIAAGRDSTKLGKSIWSEKIVEINPRGKNSADIIWQWRAWDHLVQQLDSHKLYFDQVKNHPELLDLNYEAYASDDWLHFNSIDYNQQLDQVLVSNRNFNELFIIDHGTNSSQAAAHRGGRQNRGGDLLYRWGNPCSYKRGAPDEQQFFRQHHAHWIANGLQDGGKIMVFNNGLGRAGDEYSSVDIIEPVKNADGTYDTTGYAFFPRKPGWRYLATPPVNFFSTNVSSAERLKNGHTLICEGAQGKLFEIDDRKEIQWVYVNPVGILVDQKTFTNTVFRASYVATDHPALKRRKIKKEKFLSPSDSSKKCAELQMNH